MTHTDTDIDFTHAEDLAEKVHLGSEFFECVGDFYTLLDINRQQYWMALRTV